MNFAMHARPEGAGRISRKPRRRRAVPFAAAAAMVTGVGMTIAFTPISSANAAVTSYGLFAASVVPSVLSDTDTGNVTLGTVFTSRSNGMITAIRYYKSAQNIGPHTGQLWTGTGSLLATAQFRNETTAGWQTAPLTQPVTVKSGTTYITSYTAPAGRYSSQQDRFSSGRTILSGALTATKGVYKYGGGFPTSSWNGSNYYVDVQYSPASVIPPSSSDPSDTASTATTTSISLIPPTSSSISSSTPPITSTSTTVNLPSSTKPGPSNTGVPAGTRLVASGPITANTPNQVIQGLDISGSVTVNAPGVVIRNSRIHGTDYFGVNVNVRSGSATIYDSEIYGFENGISFAHWSAYRVNIHSTYGDGVKLSSNTVLQDSWIHDLTPAPGAHSDGGQMQDGAVGVVVRHNVIDLSTTTNANSALFLAPDQGPSSNGPVTIADNWLDGGNFTVFCVDGNNGQYFVKNISIVDNRFGRHSNYGPLRVNVPITESGNVWDDTGLPVHS